MFNAWDFVFALLLALAAWLGWRLKSLPLLGAGFSAALAPLAAKLWQSDLGRLLVEKLGGEGLKPHQDEVAWWLILVAAAVALMLLFTGLSRMLAAIKLEFLDRGFGAFLVGAIFLATLSLNMVALAHKCSGQTRKTLTKSWSWAHVRAGKEPEWIQSIEEKVKSLK